MSDKVKKILSVVVAAGAGVLAVVSSIQTSKKDMMIDDMNGRLKILENRDIEV